MKIITKTLTYSLKNTTFIENYIYRSGSLPLPTPIRLSGRINLWRRQRLGQREAAAKEKNKIKIRLTTLWTTYKIYFPLNSGSGPPVSLL
jgi:hypothetical protein